VGWDVTPARTYDAGCAVASRRQEYCTWLVNHLNERDMIPNLKQSMHLARSTGEATSACPSTTVMSAERARGKQPLSPWSLGHLHGWTLSTWWPVFIFLSIIDSQNAASMKHDSYNGFC
jgi:hypothetical protein